VKVAAPPGKKAPSVAAINDKVLTIGLAMFGAAVATLVF
jgi:hypothetical protein